MYSFNVDLPMEVTLRIHVKHYRPSRPAPACSDHDHPRFSDTGDDAEWEIGGMSLIVRKSVYNPLDKQMHEEEYKVELPERAVELLESFYTDDIIEHGDSWTFDSAMTEME